MPWYLQGLGWLVSTIIGSLIGYWSIRRHDSAKARDELIGMCNTISFALALQYTELFRINEELQARQKKLISTTANSDKTNIDDIKEITQHFTFDKNLIVNLDIASKVILSAGKKRGLVEILNNVYLCNRKYLTIVEMLERYHDAKVAIFNSTKDTKALIEGITYVLNSNISEYLKFLDQALPFISGTLEAFKQTVNHAFKIEISIKLSDPINIS